MYKSNENTKVKISQFNSDQQKNLNSWSQNTNLISKDDQTIEKFKNIIRDESKKILGATIQFPNESGTRQSIILPQNIDQFDLRHFYMIMRSNVISKLNLKIQNDLTMLLINETCIATTTYAIQYGGYPASNKRQPLDQINYKKVILINQASIDFRDNNQYSILQDNSDTEQIVGSNEEKISKTKYKNFIKTQF